MLGFQTFFSADGSGKIHTDNGNMKTIPFTTATVVFVAVHWEVEMIIVPSYLEVILTGIYSPQINVLY